LPIYEIRVRGAVSREAATALGLRLEPGSIETVLRGAIRDQSELCGVLDRLLLSRTEILDVRRETPHPG
jgi:hypothetical protein